MRKQTGNSLAFPSYVFPTYGLKKQRLTKVSRLFTFHLIDLHELSRVEQSLKIGTAEAFRQVSDRLQVFGAVREVQMATECIKNFKAFGLQKLKEISIETPQLYN